MGTRETGAADTQCLRCPHEGSRRCSGLERVLAREFSCPSFPKRGTKYRSDRMVVDGITFASRKEGRRYVELKALQRAGKISDLRLQVPFTLFPAHRLKNGRAEAKATYVADFTYHNRETGEDVVEDVKGMRTREYRLKRKAMWYIHGIEIHET